MSLTWRTPRSIVFCSAPDVTNLDHRETRVWWRHRLCGIRLVCWLFVFCFALSRKCHCLVVYCWKTTSVQVRECFVVIVGVFLAYFWFWSEIGCTVMWVALAANWSLVWMFCCSISFIWRCDVTIKRQGHFRLWAVKGFCVVVAVCFTKLRFIDPFALENRLAKFCYYFWKWASN